MWYGTNKQTNNPTKNKKTKTKTTKNGKSLRFLVKTGKVGSVFYFDWKVLRERVRGGFKTQPPVDRRFRPVPGRCHCLEQ